MTSLVSNVNPLATTKTRTLPALKVAVLAAAYAVIATGLAVTLYSMVTGPMTFAKLLPAFVALAVEVAIYEHGKRA